MIFKDEDGRLVVANDYFGSAEPLVFESTGTYYEAGPDFESEGATECGWVHTLGEVVSALAGASLQIDYLHEHDAAHFRVLQCFEQNERGEWRPADTPRIPLTFSLRATK